MNNKSFLLIIIIFAFAHQLFCQQLERYQFKREISGTQKGWHKIILPDNIFANLKNDLSDIRVIGITESQDTIEAPYLLKENTPVKYLEEVSFNTINSVHHNKGYFYTFELDEVKTINEILLDFDVDNFNWNVNLEGSNDQKEWFNILNNYRIVSIKNDLTDYKFTKLSFSNANYKYYRLNIPALGNPRLQSAKLKHLVIENGELTSYSFAITNVKSNHLYNRTEIIGEFTLPVRISGLKVKVKDEFDFYRPIRISYLSDSVKTETQWLFNYKTLNNQIISSLGKNKFTFNATTLKKVKLTIENGDNEPLEVDSIELFGYKNEIVVRITKPAKYYLCYGNKTAMHPHYDIAKFKNTIPDKLSTLQLGQEQLIVSKTTPPRALLISKYWLWSIMFFIVVTLAWFSIKMIKNKE